MFGSWLHFFLDIVRTQTHTFLLLFLSSGGRTRLASCIVELHIPLVASSAIVRLAVCICDSDRIGSMNMDEFHDMWYCDISVRIWCVGAVRSRCKGIGEVKICTAVHHVCTPHVIRIHQTPVHPTDRQPSPPDPHSTAYIFLLTPRNPPQHRSQPGIESHAHSPSGTLPTYEVTISVLLNAIFGSQHQHPRLPLPRTPLQARKSKSPTTSPQPLRACTIRLSSRGHLRNIRLLWILPNNTTPTSARMLSTHVHLCSRRQSSTQRPCIKSHRNSTSLRPVLRAHYTCMQSLA